MKKATRRWPFLFGGGLRPGRRAFLPVGRGLFHRLLDRPATPLLGLAGEVPGEEGEQRNAQQDQAGHRVDLRLHAQAYRREHFHRQGGRAGSGDEAGQYQVVQRQGEGHHAARRQRGRDHRDGDQQEHLPGLGAQVHRRFLDRQVEFTQARRHHHRHIGRAEAGVGDPDGHDTPFLRPADQLRHGHEQQQQRQAGDHFRHHQRRGDHAAEQRTTAEARDAGEDEGRQGAEEHRGERRIEGDLQGAADRTDQLGVVQQADVPLHRPAAPHRHQLGGVERIDHQDQHRQVDEEQADDQHDVGEIPALHTLPSSSLATLLDGEPVERDTERDTLCWLIPCPPVLWPGSC